MKGESKKRSIWAWLWSERNWTLALAVTVILAMGGSGWYIGGLILDKHIQSSTAPIQDQLHTIQAEAENIKGILGVLQAQLAAQKYSGSAPAELRMHRDDLKRIQSGLETAKTDIPDFWPVSFEIIELLSRATTEITNPSRENVLSEVTGPFEMGNGLAFLLKDRISDITFTNAVIRFDPSVKLRNVKFINCVFIFPTGPDPSKPLREIGGALLASDISNVTIKGAS